MGAARAYLLPMMKPKTMKTRMIVPATATTAMMMTGFCSVDITVAVIKAQKKKEDSTESEQAVNGNPIILVYKISDKKRQQDSSAAKQKTNFFLLCALLKPVMKAWGSMERRGWLYFRVSLSARFYSF